MKKSDSHINERKRTVIYSMSKSGAQAGRPVDNAKDQAILRAARQLLLHQGLQAVTMEEVAKQAGVSKATLYSRHKNSDDLIAAVISEKARLFAVTIDSEQTQAQTNRQSLVNFSRAILYYLMDEEFLLFVRVLCSLDKQASVTQTFFSQGPENTFKYLCNWLIKIDKSGEISCPNPAQSSELLFGMLLRMDLIKALHGIAPEYTTAELDAYAEYVADAFLQLHQRQ